MSEYQEECVEIYKNLAKVPSLVDFVATKSDYDRSILHWEAVWSQRDLDRNARFNYKSTGIVDKTTMKAVNNPGCSEMNGEKLVKVSNNGKRRAIVREVKVKDEKSQYLEIWEGSMRISATNLTAADKHGVVHSNASFCCLEWSHNDGKLLYVAERKKQKTQSFFKASGSDDKGIKKGNEYVYNEEWGEQLVGCAHPIVVLFDVKTQEITPLDNCLPDEMCAGEAIWCENDESIVVLGWKVEPWKLGLIYCKNRPSAIYQYNFKSKELIALTDAEFCVFTPRLTPDGSSIIYLQNHNFGPHQQCAKMMAIDLSRKEKKVLVDNVMETTIAEEFHGLYMDSMPKSAWLGDKIALSTTHRSNTALIAVDCKSGEVEIFESSESWQILAVCDGVIFACHSSPNSTDTIKFGTVSDGKLKWSTINGPSLSLPDIEWQIIKYQPCLVNQQYPNLDYESILLKPASGAVKALIVNPHSGPHMCHTASFDLFSAGFCKLGYAVLRVNFRGSLGFGQNNVYSLPKNIGTQDVSDVHQSVTSTIELLNKPSVDVFIHGSSHGGSMTLQMLGQFPDFYAAGVTSNPAANLAYMVGVSDIPDWCFCESGEVFSFLTEPAKYNFNQLTDISPVKHISKIKSPLLMLVGGADIRVPPSQSIETFRYRKAAGGVVKMLVYPNNDHPIAEVLAEADCFVNMALWFHYKGEEN